MVTGVRGETYFGALWRRMEHAVPPQLMPKDWQLSIPQQTHQPQAQVGDVGNERKRHDGFAG